MVFPAPFQPLSPTLLLRCFLPGGGHPLARQSGGGPWDQGGAHYQGAIDGGLSGVYAYPGTPSTERTEYIAANEIAEARDLHRVWSANEKTAMEAALGMSYSGKRAMVCMKHVGMNVCADSFVNAAVTGVNGGLIVVAADDPSMHSSQNEQDSRFYADFAQ
ncbi:MAG: hypothetical protein HUK20_10360, partial [Fibrobacter sp.]|nr:hypothetical protein [Fibrobacter sp.]